ncbi:hypothetical protein [Desulfobacter sp.]|uniref:hypothetical protein n=1 Tax=Desulfobacter sp. TaxID=2294 RepID=UPI003D1364F7
MPAVFTGNQISTSEVTPFLQIGEPKYGKPILDRIITTQTPLNTKEAIRFYEEYDESDAI